MWMGPHPATWGQQPGARRRAGGAGPAHQHRAQPCAHLPGLRRAGTGARCGRQRGGTRPLSALAARLGVDEYGVPGRGVHEPGACRRPGADVRLVRAGVRSERRRSFLGPRRQHANRPRWPGHRRSVRALRGLVARRLGEGALAVVGCFSGPRRPCGPAGVRPRLGGCRTGAGLRQIARRPLHPGHEPPVGIERRTAGHRQRRLQC